jgi:hypothetical protein
MREQGIEVDESKYYRYSTRQVAERRDRATAWRRRVIRSDAFAKAFEDQQPHSIERGIRIIDHLRNTYEAAIFFRQKPADLADEWIRIRPEVDLVIQHLRAAEEVMQKLTQRRDLGSDYHLENCAKQLSRLTDRMARQRPKGLWGFDPRNLRTRGRAANNPEGAFGAWMSLELARLIPPSSQKRATVISRLLELADVHVPETSVSQFLRRATKTKA